MKKVLSFVLALALVVSCFTMISVNAAEDPGYGAVWTVGTTPNLRTLCGSGKDSPFKLVSAAEFGTEDYLEFTVAIKNGTNAAIKDVAAAVSWGYNQFPADMTSVTFDETKNTMNANNIFLGTDNYLQPNETRAFTFKLAKSAIYSNNANGITGSSGSNVIDSNGVAVPWNEVGLRIDFASAPAAGGTVTIVTDNENVNKSLAAAGTTTTGLTGVAALAAKDTACENAITLMNYKTPEGYLGWDKSQATPMGTNSEEETIYYAYQGMATGAWKSPYCNIYNAVKTAMGTDNKVTVKVSFKFRVVKTDAGSAGTGRFLTRATVNTACDPEMPAVSTVQGWNSWFAAQSSTKFSTPDGQNVISPDTSAELPTTFTEFTKNLTFNKADMSIFSALNICFDQFANVTEIDVTDVKIEKVETQEEGGTGEGEGEGEGGASSPTETITKTDVAWAIGYSAKEAFVDNGDSFTFKASTGTFDASKDHYKSAVANIVPALKTLIGSDDKVTVKVSFTAAGAEAGTARVLLRAVTNKDVSGMPTFSKDDSADVKTAWAKSWNTWYATASGATKAIVAAQSDTNIFGALAAKAAIGTSATAFSYELTFTKADLEIFSDLQLCFDQMTMNGATVSAVTVEKASAAEVKVPAGVKFVLDKETTDEQPAYIKTGTGVLSAADVKGGKIKKSFNVTNNGKEDIQVQLLFQVVHKDSNNKDTWAPCPSEGYVTIAPGKTAAVSYEVEVEDGKIEVTYGGNTASYEIGQFFYRINVKNTEGKSALPKGTSFTIACTDNDYTAFSTAMMSPDKYWSAETVYSVKGKTTGDFVAVAFGTAAVLAFVTLVVVVKKRKQDEVA